jgi:uncharacterized protein
VEMAESSMSTGWLKHPPYRSERAPMTTSLFAFSVLIVTGLTASSPAMALANPASVFCVKQGGKLRPEANGRSICLLPNGRAIEEWRYFRAHQKGGKQGR